MSIGGGTYGSVGDVPGCSGGCVVSGGGKGGVEMTGGELGLSHIPGRITRSGDFTLRVPPPGFLTPGDVIVGTNGLPPPSPPPGCNTG